MVRSRKQAVRGGGGDGEEEEDERTDTVNEQLEAQLPGI